VNNTNGGQDPYNRPMMERWDESCRLFQIIRELADLRRANRAMAYGSHHQKYLSDAIYAFTRRYRDSRVFTLLNQGMPTRSRWPTLIFRMGCIAVCSVEPMCGWRTA